MTDTVAVERLKSFIERIEKLEEERAALGGDIREVYGEAKGAGFDVKTMRQVVKLRKLEPAERAEMDELLDLYTQALGMAGGSGVYAAGVEDAADLFNEGKTVDQVADELGISRSEAGKLRQRAEKAGLLTVERGRGRPSKSSPEKVSRKNEAETKGAAEKVSGISEGEDISETPPSPTPMEATGDVAQNAAIGTRDGEAEAHDQEPQSQPSPAKSKDELDQDEAPGIDAEVAQPEPMVASSGNATAVELAARRLMRDGRTTVEFGGKVYGVGDLDDFKTELPDFLNRALWSQPGRA